jgi:ATP-dependent helicase/nuclease subunit A
MRPTKTFQKFNDSQKHALDTRRNLAVRANAGTGKTSVLVERIAQLLAQIWDEKKPLDLTQIVAITFTRKAAAELEDSLRKTFREMIELTGDSQEKLFWVERTNELPRAMIGTIDSFCARILREFGLLDDLPNRIEPDFQPMEGYEVEVQKREAVERTIDQLASGVSDDPGPSPKNDRIEACRWWAEHEGYRVLTSYLMELLGHAIEPAKIIAAQRAQLPPVKRVQAAWESLPAIQAWKNEGAALVRELQRIVKKTEGNEKQTVRYVREPARLALKAFEKSGPDSVNEALILVRAALFTGKNEPRTTRGLKEIEKELLSLQAIWCPLLELFAFDFAGEVRALEAGDKLALLLEPANEQYLALCREANQYDFWTIARKTRDLLARDRKICSELKDRYRFVMVDEFQDTNQLQWEIISWIVGNGPKGNLDKGRLFIVGDPQQSIYRFRKADVGVFTRVKDKIVEANQSYGLDRVPTSHDESRPLHPSTIEERSGVIPLQENYRSLKPIPLMLMDRVFEYVFDPAKHNLEPDRDNFQIKYQNLKAGVPSDAIGEVRYVIPGDAEVESENENETENEESPGVQDLVVRQVQAVLDQLESLCGQPKYLVEDDKVNTLRWKDMAILLPSRNVVLGRLEKELAHRKIPYVVASGIGFWQRQEIRDVVSLACYLADAGDELALFAVLRFFLKKTTTTEILFLSQRRRGSIQRGLTDSREGKALGEDQNLLKEYWHGLNESDRERIRSVAAQLDAWRQRVDRMAHADLLQRCLEESGAYAIYAAESGGDLILANLERLFEQIRGEESDSAPGLGRLARWMRDQVDDSFKEEQAVLAAGQDAVQIMTVHAAKGLEFPVVAVMKMERLVDRSKSPRFLVKSEWDQLLKEDEKDFPSVQPGTLAVSVRHPHRPRKTYTPRLLTALRNLEKAQDLAESRRLFYVAATRAKERLILAGKQFPPKKDGSPRKFQASWQKWFEDALGLTEEHKQKGMWHELAGDFKVRIVTDLAADVEREEKPTRPISQCIHLQYLHEQSRWPTIATTGLEKMRATWCRKPDEWWLRYRVKVRPDIPKPGKQKVGDDVESFRTVIGRMIHRLFEGPDILGFSREKRRPILEAMAHNLLASSQLLDNTDGEEVSPSVDLSIRSTVVREVEEIIEIINGSRTKEIRQLIDDKQGMSEVEFLLKVGRWSIPGRFDKLICDANGAYKIVDWKTDRGPDWESIESSYRDKQMKLYALALYRSGRPSLFEGAVHVHLALLRRPSVTILCFTPALLEEFESSLEKELKEMDEFVQLSAPLRVAAIR